MANDYTCSSIKFQLPVTSDKAQIVIRQVAKAFGQTDLNSITVSAAGLQEQYLTADMPLPENELLGTEVLRIAESFGYKGAGAVGPVVAESDPNKPEPGTRWCQFLSYNR